MLHQRPTAPPSPPNSPRMSGNAEKTTKYQWSNPSVTAFNLPPVSPSLPQPTVGHPQGFAQPLGDPTRPSLRSHRSFPYSLGPSSRTQHEVNHSQAEGPGLVGFRERVASQGPQPVGTSNLPPATYGGSAPSSPASRLTPNSPGPEPTEAQLEDDDIDFGAAEQGDEDEDRPPMTAAELRAQKRKMKRFRLTHNQTRFLMSEFARQAHPDAAHRERLSREIPGLSPRQVQVWFQNRRAKLKRLTTDDRERMLRSRALPADFDMTHALHAPFGAPPTQSMGTPLPSPGSYAPFGETEAVRPLTLDTLRRIPAYEQYAQPGQQYATPTGITPALGAFGFTPPQSATDTISPTSAASNVSAFPYLTQESPRRHAFGLPLGGISLSGQAGPGAHPPRSYVHDRLNRPMGEPVGSPLRASMSYSGLSSNIMPTTQPQERAASYTEQSSSIQDRPQQPRSQTGPSGNAPRVYGLGFSYSPIAAYQSSQPPQQSPPTHSSPQQQVEPQQYRRSSGHLAGPPITTYPPYQSAQFATPPIPQYSGFGHFPNQGYQAPYQHQAPEHASQHQQVGQPGGFNSVPAQSQHYGPYGGSSEHGGEEGAPNSEGGGVPLPHSY